MGGSTRIMEQCLVAPSAAAPAEVVLKLLHFDMVYLSYNPMKHVIFYGFECSESHFLDTIVPGLKRSFSQTLNHFLPVAGKILIPCNDDDSRMPVFHYAAAREDSIPLTVAVSKADFESLTSFHPKEASVDDELHDLVPDKLPPPALSPDSSHVQISVTACQVTLFPDKGVCIGITGHHSTGDMTSLLGFLRAWSCINRSPDDHLLQWLPPSMDRDAVPDADRLAERFWKALKMLPSILKTTSSPPTAARRVRATFDLGEGGIEALKSRASGSSFTLACAHLWTCLARSSSSSDDDEPEYLVCAADCRRLLNPPLPSNYFWNCLVLILVELSHGKLSGEGGFEAAAEGIGGAIRKVVNGESEKGIMDVSYEAIMEAAGMVGKRTVLISGSAKLDLYANDFGWGRPVKIEALRDNNSGSVVYVGKSREHGGDGMEISVLLPKPQMDAFAGFFAEGLPTAQKICSKM